MTPLFGRRQTTQQPQVYYELDLTPELRDALEDLLNGRNVPDRAVERLKTALMFARKVPLSHVCLPWSELAEEADRRHCSEPEALWDWERS